MSAASRALTGLSQALSAIALYEPGHPARETALDAGFLRLQDLLEEVPRPSLTFLDGEVVLGHHSLRDLRGWSWAERLPAVGVERIEITGPVDREAYRRLVEELAELLSGGTPLEGGSEVLRSAVRYGALKLEGASEAEASASDDVPEIQELSIGEELSAVGWVHDEVVGGRGLNLLEVELAVRSLTLAMRSGDRFMMPLVRLKEHDQYTTTHSMNVAVLSMALAEYVGWDKGTVEAIGIAGILHDIGKLAIPLEILNKPGRLSDEEREVINRHPVDGAKMIMEADDGLDLAAVITYEHHIRFDGGGYPSYRFARACHPASNLLHVCDVYDALATNRPYREAWEVERILGMIEEGSGSEFDPDFAPPFAEMVRKWPDRMAVLTDAGDVPGWEPTRRPAVAETSPVGPPNSPPSDPRPDPSPVQDPPDQPTEPRDGPPVDVDSSGPERDPTAEREKAKTGVGGVAGLWGSSGG